MLPVRCSDDHPYQEHTSRTSQRAQHESSLQPVPVQWNGQQPDQRAQEQQHRRVNGADRQLFFGWMSCKSYDPVRNIGFEELVAGIVAGKIKGLCQNKIGDEE
jgi:hypothetical protein